MVLPPYFTTKYPFLWKFPSNTPTVLRENGPLPAHLRVSLGWKKSFFTTFKNFWGNDLKGDLNREQAYLYIL